MKRELTEGLLIQENECFSKTTGVSENNRSLDFLPAFRDDTSGDVYLSRFADGRRAPIHLLEGLPDEVVTHRRSNGGIVSVKSSVISGFVHEGRFYTREEAAQAAIRPH